MTCLGAYSPSLFSVRFGARFVFADKLYMYGPVTVPLTETMPLTSYGRKPRIRAEIFEYTSAFTPPNATSPNPIRLSFISTGASSA